MWEGFRVLHTDYVVVRLIAVFPEYSHHASYYEILDLRTLGYSVGYWILELLESPSDTGFFGVATEFDWLIVVLRMSYLRRVLLLPFARFYFRCQRQHVP
jgi:hypothetical protein